eukprot:2239669-Pyramimonas_sp.AAC.1
MPCLSSIGAVALREDAVVAVALVALVVAELLLARAVALVQALVVAELLLGLRHLRRPQLEPIVIRNARCQDCRHVGRRNVTNMQTVLNQPRKCDGPYLV